MNLKRFNRLLALLCALVLVFGLSAGALAASPAEGDFTWTENADGSLTLTAYTGSAAELYLPAALCGKPVSAVGESCFAGALGLRRVHVPEGIRSLGAYAFECCTDLQKIYLPDSLREIGAGCFSGCAALSLVDIQDGLEAIGSGAFLCCDSLVQLELPGSLRELGDFAFSHCEALSSVRFAGEGPSRLPDRLFYGCSALTRLRLPEKVTAIGKRCFSHCEKLESLYFGTPLEELDAYAFEACASLSSLSLTAPVLPQGLAAGCTSLNWFSVSQGTRRLEALAFAGSGIRDLSLPAELEEIVPGAFFQVHGSLWLDEENPNYRLVDGSLYSADGKTLVAFFPADPYAEEPQTSFTLPEGVERIASYALAECALDQISFPDSLKRIDAYALGGCDPERFSIPEGVDLDPEAFRLPGMDSDQGSEAPEEPQEPQIPDPIGSVAGEKKLFRAEDYADYREISNEEFSAWSERYLGFNAEQGLELTQARIPYILRYKGEVIPHFIPMTAVQNRDPEMWAQAASGFGDDFEQTYLMMDHGLSTELHRGRMPDNLILYSGLYDSQLMAAAGTDHVPSQQELVEAIGSSFTDPIMISTTTDPGVAAGFGDTLFIIYASKEAMAAQGAVCIDAIVSSSEKEILMDAGARYRILDVGNMAITEQNPWDPEPQTLYRAYVKVELLAPETPDAPPKPELPIFTDVPEGSFYHDPVYWAQAQGIVKGSTKTSFSPKEEATRAQVVSFLWRAAGSPEPAGTGTPFTDVPAGRFYSKAVVWAVEQGITAGVSAERFAPDQGCTRGEIVTFLYRFAGRPALSDPQAQPFRDLTPGRFYTKPALWAAQQGIARGTAPGLFAPEEACTRAEVVTFLFRLLTKQG